MTNIELFILVLMVFCHILDDYYMQGLLINLKQKSWWEKNEPDSLYKHDYKIALITHAFSWAFVVMLPINVYTLIINGTWHPIVLIINIAFHAFIDDLKANKRKINLTTDQLLHLLQIIITWTIISM